MTDQPRPKKRRWSKRAVRATAWTAGATAFISALGAFGAASAPLASDRPAPAGRSSQRTIIERRIVKRIVIVDPASPVPARVVHVGGTAPAPGPAPAPAPAPSTGGS
ncbi:MAG: hypothetical protein ABI595_10255 [Actinomycetota bacterium]